MAFVLKNILINNRQDIGSNMISCAYAPVCHTWLEAQKQWEVTTTGREAPKQLGQLELTWS